MVIRHLRGENVWTVRVSDNGGTSSNNKSPLASTQFVNSFDHAIGNLTKHSLVVTIGLAKYVPSLVWKWIIVGQISCLNVKEGIKCWAMFTKHCGKIFSSAKKTNRRKDASSREIGMGNICVLLNSVLYRKSFRDYTYHHPCASSSI